MDQDPQASLRPFHRLADGLLIVVGPICLSSVVWWASEGPIPDAHRDPVAAMGWWFMVGGMGIALGARLLRVGFLRPTRAPTRRR